MAVAHDAAFELVRTLTTNPFSWTHTPVGTPRGVVVYIEHDTSATDHVTGVTYGGVAMARVVRATDTAAEPGAAEMWFLGASIPTGAQTVEVTLSTGTDDNFHCVSATVTASDDTEVVDFDGVSEDASNPAVTLAYAGRTCISYVGAHLGGSNIADYTEKSGQESVHTHDWGILQSQFSRQTTPGTSDFTAGWDRATADDAALVAVAVSEVAGGGAITLTADAASFALGGGFIGYVMPAAAAAFTLTGRAADLLGPAAPGPSSVGPNRLNIGNRIGL